VTVIPYNHVGVVVPDLDQSVAEFGARLGMEFTDPVTNTVDRFTFASSDGPMTIRIAYSKVGPPHYELIEAMPHGLYSANMGLGLHHVGMWVPDCRRRLAELEETGLEVEAVCYTPGDFMAVAYFKPAGLSGVRLEIMDDANRPALEE
jgi:catechol 2,3-dioxygenase-like lactoylglutathione lyase family enzyme